MSHKSDTLSIKFVTHTMLVPVRNCDLIFLLRFKMITMCVTCHHKKIRIIIVASDNQLMPANAGRLEYDLRLGRSPVEIVLSCLEKHARTHNY